MTPQEIIESIKLDYLNNFPNGYFSAYYKNDWLGNRIVVKIGLIANVEDCSSRIRDNDVGHGYFQISLNASNDQFVMEAPHGHNLTCVPDPKTFNALSFRRLGFRKTTKKTEKDVINHMNKYFTNFKQFVKENKKDIYRLDSYPTKYFDF